MYSRATYSTVCRIHETQCTTWVDKPEFGFSDGLECWSLLTAFPLWGALRELGIRAGNPWWGESSQPRRAREHYPIHTEANALSRSLSLCFSKPKPLFARLRVLSTLQPEFELEGIHHHRTIPFSRLRHTASIPMAAAASISAVTASFTTLSLQKSGSSAKASSGVAMPAFHGLKAGSLSGASIVDLHARVASQCVAASASSSACRGVVTMGPLEAGVGMMGTKMGMMTVFTPDGKAIPCTVVGFHEGNIVTQVKSDATDGYTAVQVGYRRVRDRKLTKPEMGHLTKVGVIPMRHLQEFRVVNTEGYEPSQRLALEEVFKEGDLIDVVGNSIGKGFQGGIKRWNFARGQMTHGSKSKRQLGSIGAGTTPGRVYPGKKMPGQMGGGRTKIRKLEIVKVDTELRALIVKGALPGKPGNLLRITPAKIVGKNIPKN